MIFIRYLCDVCGIFFGNYFFIIIIFLVINSSMSNM